jgi:hypothetical protein
LDEAISFWNKMFYFGASLRGLVSCFIDVARSRMNLRLYSSRLIALSHYPSFTHLLASEIANAGVADMPIHIINKRLGALVAVANDGVGLLEVYSQSNN